MKPITGNQRGGKRAGAGRPKGAATKRTRDIADNAALEGITPLEFMLNRMRDELVPPGDRFEAAKAAAPYIHPRLTTVEAKVDAKVDSVVRVELVGPDDLG